MLLEHDVSDKNSKGRIYRIPKKERFVFLCVENNGFCCLALCSLIRNCVEKLLE